MRVPRTDYSVLAESYDRLRPSVAGIWLSRIIEYGGIGDGSIVLDFGSGTGRYTLGISGLRAPMICGLDSSMDMLNRAIGKDRSSGVMWV